MELWIRSQDKETLIKIENISRDSENYIIGNLISDDNKSICDYWRLGHYKTKERALEVLDEIQERILNLQLVSLEERGKARQDARTKPYLECVYQMPKE